MEIKMPAIVVVAYNRAEPLQRLLKALSEGVYIEHRIPLIISIDGGENEEVVEIANNYNWGHGEKRVVLHDMNLGLRRHINECMDYSLQYDAIVLLEDDIVVGPYFYDYFFKAYNFYCNDDRVFAISLYNPSWIGYAKHDFVPIINGKDSYLLQMELSWGTCFIGKQWMQMKEWLKAQGEELPYSEEVPAAITKWKNSYAKYVAYFLVEKNKYYVVPYFSHSTNFSDIGTHAGFQTSFFQNSMVYGKQDYNFANYEEAEKYDIFFTNQRVLESLKKEYPNKKIIVDYFGIRSSYSADLVLSTRRLPYKVIGNFALRMKPWETNYYYNIKGKGLYLYDLGKRAKKPRVNFDRILYEIKDYPINDLFLTIVLLRPFNLMSKAIGRLRKVYKKISKK